MIEPVSSKAEIAAVAPRSPAASAGIQPGMIIQTVDGQPLRDILDWLWLSEGQEIELVLAPPSRASVTSITLARSQAEPWGIDFIDPLFDGLQTCQNYCDFCFIDMLPDGLRPSLYLRDDDYRLSFLQGSFVTLSNLTSSDIQRIISQRLSPLHVSLHAVDATVRRQLIGPMASVGFDNLEILLAAGIQVHVQIVLVPNENDGPVLDETLNWVAGQPNILSTGIVPYAYTRYAKRQVSYTAKQAAELIDRLGPLAPEVQLADEWFILAGIDLPDNTYYADFPQFENGIGLVTSFVQDWQAFNEHASDFPAAVLVSGEAFAPILQQLITKTPRASQLQVLAVPNLFFGGSVNTTGLLTASDITQAFATADKRNSSELPVFIPSLIFNSDGLTLDGCTASQLQALIGRKVHVVTYISELTAST